MGCDMVPKVHHLPFAADLWCCVFTSCHYPNNNIISWRSVELMFSYFADWHSCCRAVRPVMWLAQSLFILDIYNYHHTLWSIFLIQPAPLHFTQLGICMNQNSRCAWRHPYSPWPTTLCLLLHLRDFERAKVLPWGNTSTESKINTFTDMKDTCIGQLFAIIHFA